MNKTRAESVDFVRRLAALEPAYDAVDAVICPPFTALCAVIDELGSAASGSSTTGSLGVGAQTMHWAPDGAFTGEVSAPMLVSCGVGWVILGHSERRAFAAETDETIARKIPAALAHGITPIVAVGETLEEHTAGLAHVRVVAQMRAAFEGLEAADVMRCVVAYEPIWAIGTGKVDHPAGANATMGAIRGAVNGLDAVRILYGGSVKPENIGALLREEHIDGALVGGASLDPASFAALVANAAPRVAAS